jgi:hypothetical protein
LLALAIALLGRRRLCWFALVLSYAVLVRFELVLLFVPAAYVLRRHPRCILLLAVFPVVYYAISVVVSGEWTYLFERYAAYAREPGPKSEDPFHYVRALFFMAGLWPLVALPTLVVRLRRGDELMRFMGVSTLLLLLLYSLTYWRKTAFGPMNGLERYVILTAPMIAVFAGTARTPYRKPVMVVSVVIPLLLPLQHKGAEERALDAACQAVRQVDYGTLYVEHGYVNLCLDEPLHSNTIDTLEFRDEAEPGDLMLWENHYAIRLVDYDALLGKWTPIWRLTEDGFEVFLLQRR